MLCFSCFVMSFRFNVDSCSFMFSLHITLHSNPKRILSGCSLPESPQRTPNHTEPPVAKNGIILSGPDTGSVAELVQLIGIHLLRWCLYWSAQEVSHHHSSAWSSFPCSWYCKEFWWCLKDMHCIEYMVGLLLCCWFLLQGNERSVLKLHFFPTKIASVLCMDLTAAFDLVESNESLTFNWTPWEYDPITSFGNKTFKSNL